MSASTVFQIKSKMSPFHLQVRGGNNPHSPEYYHPLVITDEKFGGFNRLTEAKQNEIRVLAGVEFTRRGRPKPTAAGPLCLGRHSDTADRRLDDRFQTFKKFNRSLIWTCEPGDAAILEVTPNSSWQNTVYYNSFTHANMGWKIHIVDTYDEKNTANSKTRSPFFVFCLVASSLVISLVHMIPIT